MVDLSVESTTTTTTTPSLKHKLKKSICCCFNTRYYHRSTTTALSNLQHHHRRTSSSSPTLQHAQQQQCEFTEIKGKFRHLINRIGTYRQQQRRAHSIDFRYDPLSYALNFDEGEDLDDSAAAIEASRRVAASRRYFSSRFPDSPESPSLRTMPASAPASKATTMVNDSSFAVMENSSQQRSTSSDGAVTAVSTIGITREITACS